MRIAKVASYALITATMIAAPVLAGTAAHAATGFSAHGVTVMDTPWGPGAVSASPTDTPWGPGAVSA